MFGGFSGTQKIISKDILDKTDVEMEGLLKDSLSKDIVSQIPADFVLYTNILSYKLEKVEQVSSTNGNIVLKKKGTATTIIFDKGSLTRAILAKVLPSSGNDIIKITNLEALEFSYVAPSSASNTGSSITFSLKGSPNLIWIFDENNLHTPTINNLQVLNNNKYGLFLVL